MTTTGTYHRRTDREWENDHLELGDRAASYKESETRYGYGFIIWWMENTPHNLEKVTA